MPKHSRTQSSAEAVPGLVKKQSRANLKDLAYYEDSSQNNLYETQNLDKVLESEPGPSIHSIDSSHSVNSLNSVDSASALHSLGSTRSHSPVDETLVPQAIPEAGPEDNASSSAATPAAPALTPAPPLTAPLSAPPLTAPPPSAPPLDFIIITDASGLIVYASPSLLPLAHVPTEDAVNTPLSALVAPQDDARLAVGLKNAMASGAQFRLGAIHLAKTLAVFDIIGRPFFGEVDYSSSSLVASALSVPAPAGPDAKATGLVLVFKPSPMYSNPHPPTPPQAETNKSELGLGQMSLDDQAHAQSHGPNSVNSALWARRRNHGEDSPPLTLYTPAFPSNHDLTDPPLMSAGMEVPYASSGRSSGPPSAHMVHMPGQAMPYTPFSASSLTSYETSYDDSLVTPYSAVSYDDSWPHAAPGLTSSSSNSSSLSYPRMGSVSAHPPLPSGRSYSAFDISSDLPGSHQQHQSQLASQVQSHHQLQLQANSHAGHGHASVSSHLAPPNNLYNNYQPPVGMPVAYYDEPSPLYANHAAYWDNTTNSELVSPQYYQSPVASQSQFRSQSVNQRRPIHSPQSHSPVPTHLSASSSNPMQPPARLVSRLYNPVSASPLGTNTGPNHAIPPQKGKSYSLPGTFDPSAIGQQVYPVQQAQGYYESMGIDFSGYSMAPKDSDDNSKTGFDPAFVQARHVCLECQTTESPEWRKGPKGPKTLCNACGLRWAKKTRREDGKRKKKP